MPNLAKIVDNHEAILKKFKLQSSISSSNYVLFNSEQKIYRYGTEVDILKEFYTLRIDLYSLRKAYMLARLRREYEILVNKVKFIQGIIAESLKINKVKRKLLIKNMVQFGLKTMAVINDIMK